VRGKPSERLVASLTIHRPGGMTRTEKWRVIWWLVRQAWWLAGQRWAETMTAGKFTARMVRVETVPAPAASEGAK